VVEIKVLSWQIDVCSSLALARYDMLQRKFFSLICGSLRKEMSLRQARGSTWSLPIHAERGEDAIECVPACNICYPVLRDGYSCVSGFEDK
jgi:hypothetical protein